MVRLAAELGDHAPQDAELPEDYQLEARGRDVMVWRPIQGNLIRTAEGSDNFCRKASEVVGRLEVAGGSSPTA